MSNHVSVLLDEAIDYLDIKPGGIYVDMTCGGGGHSQKILENIPQGKLFCFDQDEYAISQAEKRLSGYENVVFINDNFANAVTRMKELGVSGVDGILFDLGVSSFQFDIPERGFSYQKDSPLDMRMDRNNQTNADVIVNTYSEEEITRILFTYGEEPFAKSIARAIVKRRAISPILTTFDLVEVIKSALPEKILRKKGHPAKQTFQALRIAVNDELGVLEQALVDSIGFLNPGGRLVTISFHSLEDRICKNIFREHSTVNLPKGVAILTTEKPVLTLLTKHVVTPKEAEILANNRAHSAKLRAVEKTG